MTNWLKKAVEELGIHEIEGAEANQRIIEYDAHTSLEAKSDEIPWCSAFVNYCIDESGLEGTHSAAARSWLEWGEPLEEPINGCIVILKRGKNPSLGHVGFFISQKQGLIRVLGGNQGDKVCFSWFSKKDVLGYRWPKNDKG